MEQARVETPVVSNPISTIKLATQATTPALLSI